MAGRRFPSSAVGRDCRKPRCGEGGLCFVKDPRENYRTRWTMNKDESFLGYVCIKYVSSINRPSNEILREKMVNLAAPFWPLPHWRFLTHFPSDFALESTTVSSFHPCLLHQFHLYGPQPPWSSCQWWPSVYSRAHGWYLGKTWENDQAIAFVAVPPRFHAVERQDLFHHLNACWLKAKVCLNLSPQAPANLAPPLNSSINPQHFPFPFHHLRASSPGDGDDFGALWRRVAAIPPDVLLLPVDGNGSSHLSASFEPPCRNYMVGALKKATCTKRLRWNVQDRDCALTSWVEELTI